ncbi:MAG: FtsW/RodA/SpoVE family cell cycle protein, partial [Candidatus Omnitrophota bacterium]
MFDLKGLDKRLIILTLLICAIGLCCLYSASYNKSIEMNRSFVMRQALWMAVGIVISFLVLFIDYQRLIDLGFVFYGAGLLMLGLVLVIGHARLGSQRWISIGGFNLQPSEFNKIIYVIMMASYLGGARARIVNIRGLAVPFLLTIPPFFLILIQPDLGTALVLMPVLLAMLFVAGARGKHLLSIIAAGAVASPFFWHFLKEYQKKRLLVFLNPDADPLGAGYTIIQSK